MKKYYICFFLLAVFLAASILTGAYIYFYRPEHAQLVPGQILESESAPEDNVVINQRQVETREEVKNYCLVAEEGFLLVFAKDRDNVCLDTHMPLSEFPLSEQEKLMEGIWFSSMMEIFNYLESYSS